MKIEIASLSTKNIEGSLLNIVNKRPIDKRTNEFLKEVNRFLKRNSFNTGSKEVICLRCLKAFIIVKAKDYEIPIHIKDYFLSRMKCEIGHDEYYLDSGNLRKIR